MQTKLYTVYDSVAEEAGPIFQAVNDAVAMRNYNNMLASTPHINPAEYKLLCVGIFLTNTAHVQGIEHYHVTEAKVLDEKSEA